MWYAIPEIDNDYLISKCGKIYSKKSNKELTTPASSDGRYVMAWFYIDGSVKGYLLHRLLARTFLDLPALNSPLEVNHIDNNGLNNCLDNLEVLTTEEHLVKTLQTRSKAKYNTCINCSAKIARLSRMCRTCYINDSTKNKNIDVEVIERLVRDSGWVAAGKSLNYSDNGLRKLYSRLSGKNHKTLKRVSSNGKTRASKPLD